MKRRNERNKPNKKELKIKAQKRKKNNRSMKRRNERNKAEEED